MKSLRIYFLGFKSRNIECYKGMTVVVRWPFLEVPLYNLFGCTERFGLDETINMAFVFGEKKTKNLGNCNIKEM